VWAQFFSMPVTLRSQAQVCGHSITGIAGSNPADGVKVFIMCVACCAGSGLSDEVITRSEES